MRLELTWDQLRELERLIEAVRTGQAHGFGTIETEDTGSKVTWDNTQVIIEIAE